jgi:hypothetical protein
MLGGACVELRFWLTPLSIARRHAGVTREGSTLQKRHVVGPADLQCVATLHHGVVVASPNFAVVVAHLDRVGFPHQLGSIRLNTGPPGAVGALVWEGHTPGGVMQMWPYWTMKGRETAKRLAFLALAKGLIRYGRGFGECAAMAMAGPTP